MFFYSPIYIRRLKEIFQILVARDTTKIFNVIGDECVTKFDSGIKVLKNLDLTID